MMMKIANNIIPDCEMRKYCRMQNYFHRGLQLANYSNIFHLVQVNKKYIGYG